MAVLFTSTGIAVDLLAPDLARLDLRRDVAEPLARLARFGGHMALRHRGDRIWSVAQHCVVGAKALAEEGDLVAAHFFLLHDAHEALIGDLTTPVRESLAALLPAVVRPAVDDAIEALKARIDRRLWALAGLPEPGRALRAAVHEMDMRMLDAEARQILGTEPRRRPDLWPAAVVRARPVRTHGALSPWSPKRAADEWMALWDGWRLPALAARAA